MDVTLNDADVERISLKVTEKLLEMLPALIDNSVKDNVTVALNKCLPLLMENMDNERQVSSQVKRDARDYMDNHRRFFTSKYRIRKEKYK